MLGDGFFACQRKTRAHYFWEHRAFETVEPHCEQFDGGIAKPFR